MSKSVYDQYVDYRIRQYSDMIGAVSVPPSPSPSLAGTARSASDYLPHSADIAKAKQAAIQPAYPLNLCGDRGYLKMLAAAGVKIA